MLLFMFGHKTMRHHMKQFLRTILRILDGSPNMYMATKNRQHGQSMLELAFITPLLAILIAGAVEVGWYTNRWLTLLEVTRVGARSATFLEGELSPVSWDNRASVHPDIQTAYVGVIAPSDTLDEATKARECITGRNYGFYSFISCVMEESLQPLELRFNEVDDIVISVFAVQTVNNADFKGTVTNADGDLVPRYERFAPVSTQISYTSELYKISYDLNDNATRDYPPGKQSIVVGRYPINANECTRTGNLLADNPLPDTDPSYENDPFDYLDNDNGTVTENFGHSVELRDSEGNGYYDNTAEYQRGYSFLGQHRVDDTRLLCFGSEFSINDVERLINMPDFIEPDLYDPPPQTPAGPYEDWIRSVYNSENEREFFEPQGITLVEVFWEHDLLLNFPLFRPLQTAFDDDMVISLWSAFPLPTAAPGITYQLP